MMKSAHEFNGVSMRIEEVRSYKAKDQSLMPQELLPFTTPTTAKTEAPSLALAAHENARRPTFKMTPNELPDLLARGVRVAP